MSNSAFAWINTQHPTNGLLEVLWIGHHALSLLANFLVSTRLPAKADDWVALGLLSIDHDSDAMFLEQTRKVVGEVGVFTRAAVMASHLASAKKG